VLPTSRQPARPTRFSFPREGKTKALLRGSLR
jgi:hypothetical protein